ncbi:quinone-dependent dihydroorotate dehydrogenase [bacterium]|nr:MAG: quinone-dependent dihydroorotate dehydrogenase [bacterium]
MKSVYKNLFKPILFKLDPEFAHELTVESGLIAARLPLVKHVFNEFNTRISQNSQFEKHQLLFKNRVGLAAGFDKNARYMPLMERLGFGFLEIGSVTALASNGNAKPRLFRLPQDSGLINRMGLNNQGVDEIASRVEQYKRDYPIGINIAKTHSPKILGEDAILDYVYSFQKSELIADYITLNISCPNTEEGKTFEEPETLNSLLSGIAQVRKTQTPIFVKLSVDLDVEVLKDLVSICDSYSMDGFICSNTSSKRNGLNTSSGELQQIGRGGLSGNPVFKKSLFVVEQVKSLKPEKTIIGVGGIDSPEKAIAYVQSGADLIQLYTGLIYYGPTLVRDINEALLKHFA